MAIALRGTPTTADQNGPSSITLTVPTGVVSGDVLVGFFDVSSNGQTITCPKAFVQKTISGTTNDGWFMYILYRVCDGTEGSSLVFTVSGSLNINSCSLWAYSGVNNTTPLDTAAANPQTATGSSATPGVSGFTTNQNGDVLIFCCFDNSTNPSWTTPTGFGHAHVSGSLCQTGAWDKLQGSAGSTGAVAAGGGGATDPWVAALIALQPAVAAGGNLPLPIYPHHRPARTRQLPYVRAKHPVRDNRALFIALPAKFPSAIVHHAQKRRIPVVKPKPRVRNRWIDERQVTAPHPDFPEQIRRAAQKKRIPIVKAKRVTHSSIELRIPQAPHPDFPPTLRHGRNQPKRIPKVTAKRRVRSSIELTIPGPLRLQNPVAAHRGQKHRFPAVKAKRAVRSSLELRIPQAPSPTLPLSVRHQRGQPRRLPSVKPKRVVRSSIELRIPQAPSATPPLPIEARRAQRKRVGNAVRKRRITAAIFKVAPASVPSLIFGRHHRTRGLAIHPKRAVRGSPQLRIPQAPTVQTAQPPIGIRAKSPRKRIFRVAAKRRVASNIQLRIPQAPATQTAQLPLPLRRGRAQPTRLYRLKVKPALRRRLSLAPFPALALPRGRVNQRKRLQFCTRRPLRSSIELRIPQAPHADFPPTLRHAAQKRRIPHIKAKLRVRSNIELRIPQAPVAFAPISIRGRTKHKLWRHMRAKAVAVSKFMQLSKVPAPFVPPPLATDILARWRNRGGPGASRIHGQG